MFHELALFFYDPVLRGPTIGCMMMCFAAALVGTIAVLRKQSLIGEALSHTSYPGVMAALLIQSFFLSEDLELISTVVVIIGACFSCLIGMWLIEFLRNHFKVTSDSALCFALASSFGIGITMVSATQGTFPILYKQMQSYLFGQAATMTDMHMYIYMALSFAVVVVLFIFFRPIHIVIFDPAFAESTGVSCSAINHIILTLLVVSTVIGIRSVGVVLMSAMLIFPAITARAWTNRFVPLLSIAGICGLVSGYFGVFLSHQLSYAILHDGKSVSFPTGPMIVFVAFSIFLASMLLAPQTGLVVRSIRRLFFLLQCERENMLKFMFKYCLEHDTKVITRSELTSRFYRGRFFFWIIVNSLQKKGWICKKYDGSFELTPSGMLWARKIIRLHRLWEVYLVECCGMQQDRVHPSAEEMEHIITPEIEAELTKVLNDPDKDPHSRPIPPSDEKIFLAQKRLMS